MLLIESKKAIFVHIEKCGGTAVEIALDQYLSMADLRIGGTRFGERLQPLYRDRFGIHKHSKAREIRKALGREAYSAYFVFTFVRDPISRIVSAYQYLTSGIWKSEISARVQSMADVRAFVMSDDFSWICPCYSYIFDNHNVNLITFIGRTEALDRDFAYVCGRLQIPLVSLTKENRSKSMLLADDLKVALLSDQSCLDLIVSKFERDYEQFGYELPKLA